MKKIALLLTVLLVITMAACTQEAKMTLGEYDGNAYSNEFFGISFDIPEGFTILSREELNQVMGLAQDYLVEETDLSKQAINLAEEQTVFYTMAMAHPIGYAENFNSNIIVQSENLSLLGKILVSDGESYLEYSIEQLKNSGMEYDFSAIESVEIDGADFYKTTGSIDYGVIIYQDYYAAILNDHALVFVLTYTNDDQKAELMTIMNSIHFEN